MEVPLALFGVVVVASIDDVFVAHEGSQRSQAIVLLADLLAAVAEFGLRNQN